MIGEGDLGDYIDDLLRIGQQLHIMQDKPISFLVRMVRSYYREKEIPYTLLNGVLGGDTPIKNKKKGKTTLPDHFKACM